MDSSADADTVHEDAYTDPAVTELPDRETVPDGDTADSTTLDVMWRRYVVDCSCSCMITLTLHHCIC